jgi:uncharacterized protein (TIGR02453 family)
MLKKQTLDFFRKLKKNNNKPWFDLNRPTYESAKADLETFIQKLIDQLSKFDTDLVGLSASQCLYRINRDIRFSNDKTPYKDHLAASLDRGGKRSGFAGYYFHLEPGESFMGAGIWNPEKEPLQKIRQEIDYNFEEFEGILKGKKFRKLYPEIYTGENVQMKRLPQGFEKDNPAEYYLRCESWMIITPVSDKELLSPGLTRQTINAFKEAKPFIDFINRAIE